LRGGYGLACGRDFGCVKQGWLTFLHSPIRNNIVNNTYLRPLIISQLS